MKNKIETEETVGEGYELPAELQSGTATKRGRVASPVSVAVNDLSDKCSALAKELGVPAKSIFAMAQQAAASKISEIDVRAIVVSHFAEILGVASAGTEA